ncbi:hypothetical protein M446_6948 [Methylobacterium sp. 4-46]|uniref:DUF6894 family protein n=1 Tax=unclassified Methylobacterium TaxID=2615210 RepID=UPI000152D934|nr:MULTISPECIES: hypothetical protein [Methylobacterium]ACA21182.1 hypothetical protein M446_6948 [Methylobacterium sp. 4-46]WFT80328.1 hypothetical protein QA634_35075 [Methylobacterium nodulans]
MTLYYFHFQNGSRMILDAEGMDLPSRADALERATHLATDLLRDGDIVCDWRRSAIRVEDQNHCRVLRVPMASVQARASRQRLRAQ